MPLLIKLKNIIQTTMAIMRPINAEICAPSRKTLTKVPLLWAKLNPITGHKQKEPTKRNNPRISGEDEPLITSVASKMYIVIGDMTGIINPFQNR